jgi:hypothetical protein
MTNWKPGMKVVCVESHPNPRGVVAGITYTITLVHVATCCGCLGLCVGVNDPGLVGYDPSLGFWCDGCNGVDYFSSTEWQFHPRRFRSLLGDEQEQLDAIEEEMEREEIITEPQHA